MKLVNFKWDQDQDGIVTLVWDTPEKPVNVLSIAAIAELGQVADAIAKDAAIKGLVLTSGKAGDASHGPVPMGLAVADLAASAHLVQGVLACLVRRGKTGQGGLVEVSLLENDGFYWHS